MDEYYIKEPGSDESRGPLTPAQLQKLGVNKEVTIKTLYYNDVKEKWLPIGTNIKLKKIISLEKEVPENKFEKELQVAEPEEEALISESEKCEPEEPKKPEVQKKRKSKSKQKEKTTISDMLSAAGEETKAVNSKYKKEVRSQFVSRIVSKALCLTMLLSAAILAIPHWEIIKEIYSMKKMALLINYPLVMLGFADLLLGIYAFFGNRVLYPVFRGRAMLTLGFGVYISWALNAPFTLFASIAFGVGIVWTTLAKRRLTGFISVILSLGSSAFLAYLSFSGYFKGLLENAFIPIFTAN